MAEQILGKPVLQSLQFRNLLSFGPQSQAIELGRLNVLIGPNGSGKSNLLEAIGLLQTAPTELAVSPREGGGVRNWLWKGDATSAEAVVEAVVGYPERPTAPLRYRLAFGEVAQKFEVLDERIENAHVSGAQKKPFFYFGYEAGRPMLSVGNGYRELRREVIDRQRSILAQREDPDQYPEVTYLGRLFRSIQLYREWNFGRYTPPRLPQPSELPNQYLSEDARNLGHMLNRLRRDPATRRALIENLRVFYEDAEDVDVIVEGGTVQVFLVERSPSRMIPATRLSDGTLRWLSLLAILLHPSPPPVICIEEPEIGLHPDMMPTLATLLRDASTRTQLIVTTHSDALVDSLTDVPDAVIVCEKGPSGTRIRQFEEGQLREWLDKYTLGQLWRSGEIGGNRW